MNPDNPIGAFPTDQTAPSSIRSEASVEERHRQTGLAKRLAPKCQTCRGRCAAGERDGPNLSLFPGAQFQLTFLTGGIVHVPSMMEGLASLGQ